MTDAINLSNALADAVASVGPSVAHLDGRCEGTTATVFSADGVLVTAHHALDRDGEVQVTLDDGRTLTGTVAGRDPSTDLAVVRVDARDLVAPRWSDGADLRVGHFALVLGRPGRRVRATVGIVSALGEAFRTASGARIDRYLDVDATLPRGFSGGPLVDATGAVVGINTAGVLRGGIALPTATVRRVVGELLTHGRVGRGYLGVGVYPVKLPRDHAARAGQRRGLVVVSLEASGAAEASGLLVGDVLLTLEGVELDRPGDLMASLEGRASTESVVRVLRAGELVEKKLTPRNRE